MQEASRDAKTLNAALPDDLIDSAIAVLKTAEELDIAIASAESCTGGLIASLLTDIEGVSHVFDRGFVTYSIASKCDLLGIPPQMVEREGVVSEPVARAMAEGALNRSEAGVTVAITGFAGKGDPSDEVGLVHIACARDDGVTDHRVCHFGDIGRGATRVETLRVAIEMLGECISALGTARSRNNGAET